MLDQEITVKIWVHPHRAYGYIKSINTCWADNMPAEGVYQSFKDNLCEGDKTEINYDCQLKKMEVSEGHIVKLISLIDSASYSFIEHTPSNSLGRSDYGLKIERGSHKVTLEWNGFEYQDEVFKKIWSLVDEIVHD